MSAATTPHVYKGFPFIWLFNDCQFPFFYFTARCEFTRIEDKPWKLSPLWESIGINYVIKMYKLEYIGQIHYSNNIKT